MSFLDRPCYRDKLNKEFTILTGFTRMHDKMTVKCSKGHVLTKRADYLITLTACPTCCKLTKKELKNAQS